MRGSEVGWAGKDGCAGLVLRSDHVLYVHTKCLTSPSSSSSFCLRPHPPFRRDFYEVWPEKFQNKTNGVTQRRWLAVCNPPLRALITESLGTDAWITDLDLLTGLRKHADDKAFQVRIISIS
jgi:hypothetical protein